MKVDLLKRWLGPKSKYDAKLPYTYEARIDRLEGQGYAPVPEHFFSDTLCGLVEFLEREEIAPDRAQLFAVYRDRQVPLDTRHCVTPENTWLARPELCRCLERHNGDSGDETYRGHRAEGDCSYLDRSRKGVDG